MELTVIVAIAITAPPEIMNRLFPKELAMNISISIAMVVPKDIIINVLRPAECLLLDLSQPTTAAISKDRPILNKMENTLISTDHCPSNCPIGSIMSFLLISYSSLFPDVFLRIDNMNNTPRLR